MGGRLPEVRPPGLSAPQTVWPGPLRLWGKLMRVVSKLGRAVWTQWDELRHAAAVIGTALWLSVRPRYWARPARRLFLRQVVVAGVEPSGFVCAWAVFVGISVVVQLAYWSRETGQSQLLGPLLVAVVARELGPLFTNIVLIARSSSAMTTELAVLGIHGEVRLPHGPDPFLHLVMPRVLSMALSAFCLTILFILVALASGYLFGAWLGKGTRNVWAFTDTVLSALHPEDIASIFIKSTLPALFSSAACCIAGLGVTRVADVPRATQQALTRSIAGLFVISAVVSLLTYL